MGFVFLVFRISVLFKLFGRLGFKVWRVFSNFVYLFLLFENVIKKVGGFSWSFVKKLGDV